MRSAAAVMVVAAVAPQAMAVAAAAPASSLLSRRLKSALPGRYRHPALVTADWAVQVAWKLCTVYRDVDEVLPRLAGGLWALHVKAGRPPPPPPPPSS